MNQVFTLINQRIQAITELKLLQSKSNRQCTSLSNRFPEGRANQAIPRRRTLQYTLHLQKNHKNRPQNFPRPQSRLHLEVARFGAVRNPGKRRLQTNRQAVPQTF